MEESFSGQCCLECVIQKSRRIKSVVTVHPLTKYDLPTLEGLLRASYGADDFALADEQEYFPDPSPSDWFWLRDELGQPVGFLRHFPAGEDLLVAELYVPDTGNASVLLDHFKRHHTMPTTTRLRFDLNARTAYLERTLRRFCQLVEVRQFERYSLRLEAKSVGLWQPQVTTNLEAVRGILGSLRQYEPEQLERLLNEGWTRVLEVEGAPVAALHVQEKGHDQLEIVALSTRADALRRGHARALLRQLVHDATGHFERIGLQVNAENTAAIGLYRQLGFQSLKAATERWMYTRWS